MSVADRPETKKRRILLVEDEPALREQVRFLLEQEGYAVEAACDGLDALSRVPHFRPELILADVRMPRMDGFEFCAALRANRDHHAIPFVFLTSRDGKEDRMRGRNLGADDYITKPFEVDELLAVIQSRLRRTEALTAEAEGRVSRRVAQTISHELKTPLTVIQGLASLLKSEGGLDEKTQREFLSLVIENGELLNRHVDNLLALQRADGGAMPEGASPIDVGALVTDVLRAFEPAAKKKGLTVTSQIASGLSPIRGHRSFLLLLLTNLVDNAIKFTDEGGGVTIFLSPAETGVELRVADSGVGMSPEHVRDLFRDFHREENAAHTIPGTGLGLALCRRVAKSHGGSIRAASEKGRGTTVTVTLPGMPPVRGAGER